MKAWKHFLTTAILLISVSPITAFSEQPSTQELPPDAPSVRDASYNYSITLSPLHLINPVFELTAEFQVIPKLGVALIGAYGSQTTEVNKNDYTFPVWELGAQGRYYLLGDFSHGMQLGLEALYLNISDKTYTDGIYEIYAYGSRLEFGAFLGYKIATNIGFTFEAQAGAKYAKLMDGALKTPHAQAAEPVIDTISPLINLNLGWSF